MLDISGQWMGLFEGDNRAAAVIEIDNEENRYVGSAYFFPMDQHLPNTRAVIDVRKDDISSFEAAIIPINYFGHELSRDQLSRQFPNAEHGSKAAITIERHERGIRYSFATDIGTNGTAVLKENKAFGSSMVQVTPSITDWETFKAKLSSSQFERCVFRGQPEPFQLRTSFHRTNRSDLARYTDNDIVELNKRLSPLVSGAFDLGNTDQFGAFINLLQHHGYPTPILDWTESPFVAAFFAFRRKSSTDKVRVFVFDREAWERDNAVLPFLSRVKPHLSFINFAGILNDRTVPQQSVSTLTNIDNVESFILHQQDAFSAEYICAIDLPSSQRSVALKELRRMGITAASLFPGLDGSCESFKHKNFAMD